MWAKNFVGKIRIDIVMKSFKKGRDIKPMDRTDSDIHFVSNIASNVDSE